MARMTAIERPVPAITLGWRLRMSMEHAGIKTDEMARRLDVHRGTITRWTRDVGSPPKRLYLQAWADMCGVSYIWLSGGDAAASDTGQASGDITHGSVALPLAA